MITGRGREIISRYMLGHTSTYAGYISIGVGGAPFTGQRWFYTSLTIASNVATLTMTGHPFQVGQYVLVIHQSGSPNISGEHVITATTSSTISFDFTNADIGPVDVQGSATQIVGDIYSDVTTPVFETQRLPIIARGFANDDESQLIFTAELPTNERVVITESGLWTAADDPGVLGSSSRLLFTMDQSESWISHSPGQLESVPLVPSLSEGSLSIDDDLPSIISTNTSNDLFASLPRLHQYEGGRIGQTIIGLKGDSSIISSSNGMGVAAVGSSHIHASSSALDFSNNNTDDEIRIALFVSNIAAEDYQIPPTKTQVLLEFLYAEDQAGYASLYAEIDYEELAGNRYYVIRKTLSDLTYSANFSWSNVRLVKISAACEDENPSNYYIFIDGIRIENVSINNPLYGLTAYSIVRDNATQPPAALVSDPGEPGYIEFRLGLEVL